MRDVRKMKIVPLLIVLALGPKILCASEVPLTEARDRVENYVVEQGYTESPTSLRPEELDGSSFERLPRSQWIEARQGVIHPRAVAFSTQVRGEAPGWTFGFEYKLPKKPSPEMIVYAKQHFFSVQIRRNGTELMVLHSSLPKSLFQPLKK
jgi:hypothetical protein